MEIPGQGRQCIDTMGKKAGESVGVSTCHGLGGNQVSNIFTVFKNIFTTAYYRQVFAVTRQRQIMSDDKCLDSKGAAGEAGVSMVR